MENKKLIIDFMGIKPVMESPDVYTYSDSPWITVREDKPEKVMSSIVEYVKYDTSWEWLMKVVEKIEDMGIDIVMDKYYCKISHAVGDIEVEGKNRFDSTYKAIVEFIKYYKRF